MRQFAKYLDATPLAVVPPVLLSTRNEWRFVEGSVKGYGHLEIAGPAAIIDGQHRLGGFVFLFEKYDMVRNIDFVAFENLSLKLEAKVFNTINGKAKGVPKGIGKIIEGSWSTRVVQMLMDSQDSPFYGKIYIANKKETPGALFNLSSFDKEVIRTFSHGSFSGIVAEENIDLMYEIMQGYWDLIAEFFPVEWEDIHEKPKDQSYKLMELTGIIAFSSAAGDILGPNFDFDAQTMDWEQVRAILEALAEGGLDLRKDGEFAGFVGFIGGPKIHKKIQRAMANMDL
jgi:DNA sulfur modification protein DndB